MSEDLDTDYTHNVVCPHCGKTYMDSWEYNDCDGDIIECGNCNGNFILTVYHETTYSTEKEQK